MAYKVQKPCKVCGKMYTPCNDCENDKSVFHWRTVACSQECAAKYFEMVEKARNKPNTASTVAVNDFAHKIEIDKERVINESMAINSEEIINDVSNKKKKSYKNIKENNVESEQID